MKRRLTEQKGLTLVEVLAALVILGVLFIGVMAIFPQMTLFNVKTGTKLDTMNLARQEIAVIEADSNWMGGAISDFLSEDQIALAMEAQGYSQDTSGESLEYLRFHKNGDYNFEVDIYLKCEPLSAETPQCGITDVKKLYKVHLKVMDGTLISSETYSYITYTSGNSGG